MEVKKSVTVINFKDEEIEALRKAYSIMEIFDDIANTLDEDKVEWQTNLDDDDYTMITDLYNLIGRHF